MVKSEKNEQKGIMKFNITKTKMKWKPMKAIYVPLIFQNGIIWHLCPTKMNVKPYNSMVFT